MHGIICLQRVKTLTCSALKGTLWKIITFVTRSVYSYKYNIPYIKVKEWVHNTEICMRAYTWVRSCVHDCVKYINFVRFILSNFQIFRIYINIFFVDKFILTVFSFFMPYLCATMYNFALRIHFYIDICNACNYVLFSLRFFYLILGV